MIGEDGGTGKRFSVLKINLKKFKTRCLISFQVQDNSRWISIYVVSRFYGAAVDRKETGFFFFLIFARLTLWRLWWQ